MKKMIAYFFCVALSLALLSESAAAQVVVPSLAFRENKGQVQDEGGRPRWDILYSGRIGGLHFHIKRDGIHYLLVEGGRAASEPLTLYRVDVDFVGGCAQSVEAHHPLPWHENFYNTGGGEVVDVRSYREVRLRGVWEGIDMRFYQGKDGGLEYDFEVAPGAAVEQIRLRIRGGRIALHNGELILSTPLGEIVEGAPAAWVGERQLPAAWHLLGNQEVGLLVEGRLLCEAVRIDPPVRVWGSYFGGERYERAYAVAVDQGGGLYVAGTTASTSQIATTGTHQTTLGGQADAFLAKFDAGTGQLRWATYYGGARDEAAQACAVEPSGGHIYLAGSTYSSAGIATAGAHQTSFGGEEDAFLVKLNAATGTRLWATYYGGNDIDVAYGVAEAGGAVYMVGLTFSSSGIASDGAHQTIPRGGGDAFIVRFNASGVREWGTYLGGDGVDYAEDCVIDPSGALYVAGGTSSRTDIATAGAHQTSYGGGERDAFLVKFSAGGQRLWGTYYGGPLKDEGYACAVEPSGSAVYLAGRTDSPQNIATPSAHQSAFGLGAYDAFLVRFSSNGQRQWGTYYGGFGQDEAFDCAVDGEGTVYIVGRTYSRENIASVDAYQPLPATGGNGFIARFAASGRRIWGTYYGGDGQDEIHACTASQGYLYFAGETNAAEGIATAGTHQPQLNPASCGTITCSDAFVAKVEVGSATLSLTDPNRATTWDIFPIPARHEVTLSTEHPVEIEVYDLQGRCIDRWVIPERGSQRFSLNLPAGLYWLRERLSFSTRLLLIQP